MRKDDLISETWPLEESASHYVSFGYDLTKGNLAKKSRPLLLEDLLISEPCALEENASHHLTLSVYGRALAAVASALATRNQQ